MMGHFKNELNTIKEKMTLDIGVDRDGRQRSSNRSARVC